MMNRHLIANAAICTTITQAISTRSQLQASSEWLDWGDVSTAMEIEALAQQSETLDYDVTPSQTALAQADSEATPAV